MFMRAWLALSCLGWPVATQAPAQVAPPPPAQLPIFLPPPPLPTYKTAREYVERGEARFAAGRVQGDPTSDFEAALKLDPKCARAYVGRGLCYMRKFNNDQALRDFDKAVSLDPKDARALSCRGDLHLDKGRPEQALRDYDKSIQLDPGHVNSYLGRAVVRLYSDLEYRDHAKAIADIRRACELTEWKNWEYLLFLAAAYAEAGDFAEAIRWQREVEKDFKRRGEELPIALRGKVRSFERCWQEKLTEALGFCEGPAVASWNFLRRIRSLSRGR